MDTKAALIFVAGLLLVTFAVLGFRERSSGNDDSRSVIEKLLRIKRGAESECFRVLVAKEEVGRLTSPGYPDSYPANANCRWLLTTMDENDTISLIIDNLAIEPERDCSLDYLTIYLGSDPGTSSVLGRFCGIVKERVLETNSSRVLLVFHSDVAYEDKGFAVDYFIKSAGDCKKSLDGDFGSFTSPGFPKGYPDGADCSTLIEVQPGRKVALHFGSVDLEPGENCTFDYVRIHDGSSHNATVLGQICQGTDTRTFESSSNSLLVHFHSDDSVNRRGFRARYNSVDARSSPIGDCVWDAGERNGSVSSPNYPENYPSFANCSIWLLAPEGWRVLLKIEALLLELEANCSYDFLQIEEGGGEEGSKFLGRFCGRTASEPKHVVSNNNEVRIRFQSDDFVEFFGFKLSYEFFKEERREETTHDYDDSSEESFAFSIRPSNASLAIGSSHSLQCGVDYPNTKIRWLKGEMFLAGDSPLPSLKVLPNNTLFIQSMGHHLAGRYTCVAVSPEGSINATADIRVEEADDDGCKLEFRKTPQDSEVEEGDFVLLECLAPDAHVTWERGGLPLPERDHITVIKSGHVFVDGAEMDDAGLYTCIARDVQGKGCERRAQARLTVHARPDIDKICGLPKIAEKKPTAEGNIVGGHDAEKGAYPWQVMLWGPKRGSFCGATLLDERWILTAAHCLDNEDIPWYTIRIKLGKHDRERKEEEEFETSIADPSDIKLHPGYRRLTTFDNDLAVVRMRDRAPFTNRILPVCLGDRNLTERLISSGPPRTGTVIGWGKLNQHGGLPRFLQEIKLPLVDPELCKDSTRQTVTRNMFCAGYAQEVIGDACKGDSGGPFLMQHEGRWYVVGIVSWGEGCGQKNKYGFYTRVANHLSWIRGYVKS